MSLIWKALLLIRATGISTVWKIFRYTWLKRNLDKPFNQKQNLTFRGPGNLRNVTPGEQGLTADFDNATLSIRFLDDDLVKISWSNEDQIISSLLQENNLPSIQVQVEWHNDGWQATSHGMKVHLQRDGSLKFVNPFGKLVRFTLPPEFQANSNIRNTHDSSGWRDTANPNLGNITLDSDYIPAALSYLVGLTSYGTQTLVEATVQATIPSTCPCLFT